MLFYGGVLLALSVLCCMSGVLNGQEFFKLECAQNKGCMLSSKQDGYDEIKSHKYTCMDNLCKESLVLSDKDNVFKCKHELTVKSGNCIKLGSLESFQTALAELTAIQEENKQHINTALLSSIVSAASDESASQQQPLWHYAASKRDLPFESMNYGRKKRQLPFETLNYGKRNSNYGSGSSPCDCSGYMSMAALKRALPFDALLTGKRGLPFETLNYGKRAYMLPQDAQGYILGKREE